MRVSNVFKAFLDTTGSGERDMTDIEEYEEEDYESDLRKELNAKGELKPCPFCGSENVRDSCDCGYFWVECVDCGCSGPRSFENYEWAIEKWNRREVKE